MPDMYDKLGDLLNDALESGKIPEFSQEFPTEFDITKDRDTSSSDCDKSGLFSFNKNQENRAKIPSEKVEKHFKIPKKEERSTAEVIKMHKYTEIMHIPPVIRQAVTTLDIVYPYTTEQLNKQYRKLLKLYHPDRKNTIQNRQSVLNNRHLTIDEITYSYKILKEYIEKQEK